MATGEEDYKYPVAIDKFTTKQDRDPVHGIPGDGVVAKHTNDLQARLIKTQEVLGTNPQGSKADLKTRLEVSINDDGTLKVTVLGADQTAYARYFSPKMFWNHKIIEYSSAIIGVFVEGMCATGKHLWLSGAAANLIYVIDPISRASVTDISAAWYPYGFVFTGKYVIVTEKGGGVVHKFDPYTYAHVASSSIGANALVFPSDGTYFYLYHNGDVAVNKYRVSDLGKETGYSVPGFIGIVCYINGYLFVNINTDDKIRQIDVETDLTVADRVITGSPVHCCYDGENVWFACPTANKVKKYKLDPWGFIAEYTVTGSPEMVVFDGTYIWVSCTSDNTMKVIRASDGTAKQTFTFSHPPYVSLFDGHYVSCGIGWNGVLYSWFVTH